MRTLTTYLCFSLVSAGILMAAERPDHLNEGKRIIFLGDSITAAGDYVAIIDARLRLQWGDAVPEILNLGLPSEGCTGLSEPDHPFPRPDVHERLARALEKAKPDVVVACYGMNDGIYYPFDADRFRQYREGIRRLVTAVEATGAQCILLTPPAFDPQPFEKKGKLLPAGAEKYAWFAIYEGYADVIQRYADWLMSQSDLASARINVHDPVRDLLMQKRQADPAFAMSSDGVHIDRNGHRVLADTVLRSWGLDLSQDLPKKLVDLSHQRHRLLHAAWLSHVGHKRPGGKPGLPLAEARRQARLIEGEIGEMLEGLR